MTPEAEQIVIEAFAAFGAWLRDQPDEVQNMDILDQVELYHAAWCGDDSGKEQDGK